MSIFGRKKPAPQSIGLHSKPSPLSEQTAKNLGIERNTNPVGSALKKLNTRERVLLVSLLIVAALTAAIYFVIVPAANSVISLQDEITALETQKASMDAVIARDGSARDDYQLSKQDYNLYQQFFYPYLAPEELDRMVTQMLVDAGLDPTRLSMTSLAIEELPLYAAPPLVPEVVPGYLPVQPEMGAGAGGAGAGGAGATSADGSGAGALDAAATGTDAGTDSGSTGGTGTGASTGDPATGSGSSLSDPSLSSTSSGEVYVYTVDIAADGCTEALFRFLTAAYALQGVEVTSWSYQEPSAIVTNDGVVNQGTVNLQLKIYVFLGEPLT